MTHTPGPWEFEKTPFTQLNPDYTLRVYATDPGPENQFTIAFVYDPDKPTRTAHARLIAAAPELLEALKTVVASAHPHPAEHPAMTKAWAVAEAAIAKATGGAQ